MNIDTFLGFFSSNLYLKRIGNKYCVIDSCHENDKDYNYGVYMEFEEINSVEPSELIPDVYVDGLIQFLFIDEFPNHYNLDRKIIDNIDRDLSVYGLEMLDKICWYNGVYSVSKNYSQVC